MNSVVPRFPIILFVASKYFHSAIKATRNIAEHHITGTLNSGYSGFVLLLAVTVP